MNLSQMLNLPKVVDDLTTTSTTDMLSANQGVEIKILLDAKAPLVDGLVPALYLPSYVDDVLEFANAAAFPGTGEQGKIYVSLDDNKQHRWSGTVYIDIVASPGTTDNVTEGSTNKYFLDSRVRSVVLTSISFATNAVITASDTVLSAFGKIQKQISDLPNIFVRYDASQTLSDLQKSQVLTNIGAKKSYNLLPTKTASYTLLTTDFQDSVDLYDKVYLRMNLTAIGDVTIGTALTSLPNLTEITIRDLGAARVTLVESGTVLNGIKTFTVQNEVKTLVKVGANEWDIIGALT